MATGLWVTKTKRKKEKFKKMKKVIENTNEEDSSLEGLDNLFKGVLEEVNSEKVEKGDE